MTYEAGKLYSLPPFLKDWKRSGAYCVSPKERRSSVTHITDVSGGRDLCVKSEKTVFVCPTPTIRPAFLGA